MISTECLIVISCISLTFSSEPLFNNNNNNQRTDIFALLSGTLRTFTETGCDNDLFNLKCPVETGIAVQSVQYRKSVASDGLCSTTLMTSNFQYDKFTSVNCTLTDAIKTVVELCQKKSYCNFQASPTTFWGDSCANILKYIEIAYKCRPFEFRSKVACENERIQLKCNPNLRVAIYSASYGRTKYESVQCPQPQGVPEESCLASYATENVMQLCHGKRKCELSADIGTFGSPCNPQSRMYLKVVYTCVPRNVLKDIYDQPLEPDETELDLAEGNEKFNSNDGVNENIREIVAPPTIPNLENIPKENFTKQGNQFRVEKEIKEKSNNNSISFEIHHRYVIYLSIGIVILLLLVISIITVKMMATKKDTGDKETTFYSRSVSSDPTLANGFTDNISEVDADIDLQTTTSLPIPSPSLLYPVPSSPNNPDSYMMEYAPSSSSHSQHSHRLFRDCPRIILETEMVPTQSLRDENASQYYYG